ncbi:MAG TPA: type I glyceraldehyde-3-phosphate dehydrogenase [Thermoanaerobaculia bacterium]|nr:type I glyceraldehyde-3-phosphate dehydrogenase [Thermoanaerobaculia bacterium]
MERVRFAINGLGRVGRALVRIARRRPDLELVAINDQADPSVLARLLAHDTLHGRFPGEVAAEPEALRLDGRRVPVFQASRPEEIPWGQVEPWVVVESTGQFRSRDLAARHLGGPVAKVVVSATAEGVDATFCVGVNHTTYDPGRHVVVSNASCTANCLAPVARVLDEGFGIEHALMTTVHCYTNSQRLMDFSHPDPRRARAAAMNIVPTTSDAVEAIGEVMPGLAGRVGGVAYRVPVPDGSLVDLSVRLGREACRAEVEGAFRSAASGDLAGILAVTDEELVSSDFIGDPHSATVDLPLLSEVDHRLFRVVAWYDNEWGYANRLADLLAWMGRLGGQG